MVVVVRVKDVVSGKSIFIDSMFFLRINAFFSACNEAACSGVIDKSGDDLVIGETGSWRGTFTGMPLIPALSGVFLPADVCCRAD